MLDSLVHVLARFLTPLFALGLLGSTVVVAITFVHDVVDFFTDDEPVLAQSRQR